MNWNETSHWQDHGKADTVTDNGDDTSVKWNHSLSDQQNTDPQKQIPPWLWNYKQIINYKYKYKF